MYIAIGINISPYVLITASTAQWTDTPILIKMYKLLINELAHQIEEAQFTTTHQQSSGSNGHTANEVCSYIHVYKACKFFSVLYFVEMAVSL